MKIVAEAHRLSLSDRLDFVYKYARLYFKYLDKQYYSESNTRFNEGSVKEESKSKKKDLGSRSKIYKEVTDWLLD